MGEPISLEAINTINNKPSYFQIRPFASRQQGQSRINYAIVGMITEVANTSTMLPPSEMIEISISHIEASGTCSQITLSTETTENPMLRQPSTDTPTSRIQGKITAHSSGQIESEPRA
ncbi:hypothetical protein RJ641_012340 [Dillenia turbinata]|uniref:Uncharacterized protein n=1 Tax=Dillenia turbinata TaxID=194707 RepID=A0AAN8URI2_9MAGN